MLLIPKFKTKLLCAAILMASQPVLQAGELDLGTDVSIIGDLGLSFAKVAYTNDAGDRAVYENIAIKLNLDLSWDILTDPANADSDGVFTLSAASELKKFADDVVQLKNVQFQNKSYVARIQINPDRTWDPIYAVFSTPQDIPVPAGFSFGMTKDVSVSIKVMGADGKPMANTGVIIAEPSRAEVDFSEGETGTSLVDHTQDKELASGQTDAEGNFTTTLNIASRIKSVRVTTSNIGVPNPVADVAVVDGSVNFVADGNADDSAYYSDGNASTADTAPDTRRAGGWPLSAWQYLLGLDAEGNRILGQFDPAIFDWNGIHRNGYDANPPVIPQSVLDKVSQKLTERRQFVDELADANGASLHLVQEGEVKVSFLSEGAGYKNVFGYFTYPDGQLPASRADIEPVIVFPNASFTSSGGSGLRDGGSAQGLRTGDTINLGTFPANTRIGFFVFGNGWRKQNRTPDDAWVFHTVPSLNSEPVPAEGAADLRQHTVLLDAGETGVVMGMEDILRTRRSCDHDFNDVVFLVNADPADAIDRTDVPPLEPPTDSDNDGVDDPLDSHPDDPERASVNQVIGTLAYEDLWPSEGDYDLNDLVLGYTIDETLHANGDIKDISASFEIRARGASLENGFAISLDGLAANVAQTATISRNGGDAEALSAEDEQSKLVFNLLANAHPETVITQGDACEFFNTEPACKPAAQGGTFTMSVVFDTPQARDALGYAPYNPFLYRSADRGLEIHLPDMAPTDLSNTALLGTEDDASDAAAGVYYKTSKGLPWALNIPAASWRYPAETLGVTDMYLDFFTWAQSGGTEKADWYLNPSDESMLYE